MAKKKNISLEEENRHLQKKVEELTILNDIASEISSTLTMNQVADLINQKCIKYLKVEQAALVLLTAETENHPFQTMARRNDTPANILPHRLDAQLIDLALKNREPLLINDFVNDERLQKSTYERFPVRSLLSVPLIANDRMIGLLITINKKSQKDYTEDDQKLLSMIAIQSAPVIEHVRHFEKEQVLMLTRKDMQLAHDIQSKLLPKKRPRIKGYEITGVTVSAPIVGGDYFDFITIDANKIAICVVDVSGQGVPAALLMSNLQAVIRSHSLLNLPPKECLQNLNKLLYQTNHPQKLATLFYGIFDFKNNELCYANAGHNWALLFTKDEEHKVLENLGDALGLVEEVLYEEAIIPLDISDLVLIYSDGITKAKNSSDQEFGDERLITLVKKNKELSANAIIEKLIAAVKYHVGDRTQMDDMTLVVIKRKKS